MGYNPSKSTWMNPNIEFLFNSEIIEYDMRDAGFSIIKQFRILTPDQIHTLEVLSHDQRVRAIGTLQIGNKELSKALLDKFAEMRELFIVSNNIDSNSRIISVKKDAIFAIGQCEKLKFGKVEFVPKRCYTSYIRFVDNMNIEIYYVNGEMDIKGIGDSGIRRHRLYLLTFLQKMFLYLEGKNPSLKRYLKKFIDDYKSGKLDTEYYMEFNNKSQEINADYNYRKVIIPLLQISLREMI